jgi:transcription initiation factor TFIIB
MSAKQANRREWVAPTKINAVQETCPDCKTSRHIVDDHAQGCRVCSNCGLRVENNYIDRTQEWRSFADDGDSKSDPNRIGGPENAIFGDVGLSTMIGTDPRWCQRVWPTQNVNAC